MRPIALDVEHVVDQVDRAGPHAEREAGLDGVHEVCVVRRMHAADFPIGEGDGGENEDVLDPLVGPQRTQQ